MRGRASLTAAMLTFGGSLAAGPAHACTLCHSRIADDVRAAVFGPGFWSDAVALISPVPLLAAMVIVMRRYLP
ncbi:hypothetical protein GCM10022268_28320 [Sphingomonas cynarae]|uniref:Uncharacterized protein n=1 Tax=Sphingomonas cynarae TaxID=930197 RepID=A0ABP7EH85_9SPHN